MGADGYHRVVENGSDVEGGSPSVLSSTNSSVVDLKEVEEDVVEKDPQRAIHSGESTSVAVSVLVCLFYVTVSGAMVFLNKALSYSYGFRTTNALLLMQMVWQIVVLWMASRKLKWVQLEPFCLMNAKKIAPVSFFYCLNSAFALAALRELSVPSYSVIKRLAPMVTLVLEFFMLGKRAESGVVWSLLIMAAGTVMVANSDATSSMFGWFLGAMSNVLQALYLVFVKKTGAENGFNSLSILFYHSILSIPFLAILMIAVGEIQPLLEYPRWHHLDFHIMLFASLSMGLLLNYSLFLCTEKTSATSTLVSGQFKAIAQTILGLFTFGGVEITLKFIIGLIANVIGGFGYAYTKYQSMRSTTR